MGGGKGGGGDTESTLRYAPYIETAHNALIAQSNAYGDPLLTQSPYANYTITDPDLAFFGVGYTIASFPTLFDMFGKFMAGLDIEVLYEQIFNNLMELPQIGSAIVAQSALLDDELQTTSIPRLQTGMRDINAVQSSSFIIGKTLIEDTKVKVVNKFAADLRYQMIPIATERWKSHLEWNKGVVITHMDLVKFYYVSKLEVDKFEMEVAASNKLWPFQVLDYKRAIVGAVNGATAAQRQPSASPVAKALAGTMTGAATGAMIGSMIAPAVAATSATLLGPATAGAVGGGPIGALIGGALGLIGGLLG